MGLFDANRNTGSRKSGRSSDDEDEPDRMEKLSGGMFKSEKDFEDKLKSLFGESDVEVIKRGDNIREVIVHRDGGDAEGVLRRGVEHLQKYREFSKKLNERSEDMAQAISAVARQAKLKPFCKDAKGQDLVVGSTVAVPDGSKKEVLAVGFGFCELSKTGDLKKSDGIWFQGELVRLNFIQTK